MTAIDTPLSTDAPIVARAGRYFRNARYIMVAAILAFAGMFAYDGYVAWPAKNVQIQAVEKALNTAKTDAERIDLDRQQRMLGAPKSETDIGLQKKLAFILPVVAIGYLVYMLRKSRGEIRFEDATLFAPGHPPIALANIRSLDSSRWDKKGIARVNYQTTGKSGRITLDNFVYQSKPIDAIYDRLVAGLKREPGAVVVPIDTDVS